MANPNIVNVSDIRGETESLLVTTSGVAMAANGTNGSATNKVHKINVLTVSNIDGINDADITVAIRTTVSNSSSTVIRHIVKTVTVPADSTLVVIDKNTSIYIKEDSDLFLTASAAGDLEATVSYETIQ